MAEHPHDRDRERIAESERTTTHVTERSSSTGIAAVVGGLVVAVLLIFWLFTGVDDEAEVSGTTLTVEENETAVTDEPAEEMVGTGTEAEGVLPETEAEPAAEAEPAEETQATEEPAAEEEPATSN